MNSGSQSRAVVGLECDLVSNFFLWKAVLWRNELLFRNKEAMTAYLLFICSYH
jgi:hypothetical protein